MTNSTKKTAINTTRDALTNGTKTIEKIKEEVKSAKPELEKEANLLLETINSALNALEQIIPEDEHVVPTIRRFARRLLSREVIIAIIAMIAIWAGDLDAEQAIGVAVAGTGLILGRSAVKTMSKTTES